MNTKVIIVFSLGNLHFLPIDTWLQFLFYFFKMNKKLKEKYPQPQPRGLPLQSPPHFPFSSLVLHSSYSAQFCSFFLFILLGLITTNPSSLEQSFNPCFRNQSSTLVEKNISPKKLRLPSSFLRIPISFFRLFSSKF